eukprot:gene8015-21355_t
MLKAAVQIMAHRTLTQPSLKQRHPSALDNLNALR